MAQKTRIVRNGVKQRAPRMSDQRLAAVNEYFKNGFNKRQALLKAGYAKTTAHNNSQSVFSRPDVRAEIEKRLEKDRKKYEVDRDFVIQRLARIADGGSILARYKRVNEDGSIYWDFEGATPDDMAVITELTTDEYAEGRGKDAVKIKKFKVAMADPKGALDSLARTLGLFQDKVEVKGDSSLVERLNAGRRRVGSRDT